MRLFVAVFPPPEVQTALAEAALRLPIRGDARMVRPENIHLTLKFLGEVPDEVKVEVHDILKQVALRHAPVELSPSGFGAFPSMRRAKVIWAGMEGDAQGIQALAEDVDESLETPGFERERRPFTPHFTLGRARKRSVELLDAEDAPISAFEAIQLELMRSETRKEGVRYTRLAAYPLKT